MYFSQISIHLIIFLNIQYKNKQYTELTSYDKIERKNRWLLVSFDINSATYLMYDPLLHYVRHDLEVYGPCDNTG